MRRTPHFSDPRTSISLVVAAALLAACGGDGDDTGPAEAPADADGPGSAIIVTTTSPPATTAPPATDPAPGTTAPPATDPAPGTSADVTTPVPDTLPPSTTVTPESSPEPVVGDPAVRLEPVTEIDRPVDLAVRAGEDALYLVGQRGRIHRFDPATGDRVVVLDLAGRLSDGSEQGLLGLAFSPDGALAYVNFTDNGGTTVIAEYPVRADGRFFADDERVVLRVDQPFGNHNAGDLAFGPDDTLYIPLGDGGSGGDPGRRASDPTSLLGSLLRIDPTPSGDAAYTIPADNPFADGVDGAPEVLAYGLRNPWKIAIDPVSGDLWIADVGQNLFEEVNRVAPAGDLPVGWGHNFGWSGLEGTEPFNGDVATEGTTLPVLTYGRGDGCSVSGGVPYRGTAIAGLEPAYLYSDFCGGELWALDLAGGRVITLATGLDEVTAVRAGPDGEAYVLQRSGAVLRLVPA